MRISKIRRCNLFAGVVVSGFQQRASQASAREVAVLLQHSSSMWIAVDWAVAAYTLGVGLLILLFARAIDRWPFLLAGHAALLAILYWLPARGAPWERGRSGDVLWLKGVRRAARFVRYTYPAILLTAFFEEVGFFVNAISPSRPFWFEPYLYAADRVLFGATPALSVAATASPILDELMHALYFSYYPLIIGGVVIAWLGPDRGKTTPGEGFDTAMTSMMLGFFFAYVWYPFLPARGPWENRELMSGLRAFHGFFFTPLARWIIDKAGVSGGCFPSAHVAGTWGLIVGLSRVHRRHAVWFALLAAGLGVSCVYTRYHHAVDVLAGLIVGLAGGLVGRALTAARR